MVIRVNTEETMCWVQQKKAAALLQEMEEIGEQSVMAKTLSTDNYLQTAYASPCG